MKKPVTELPPSDLFRTAVMSGDAVGVDRKAKRVNGASVMQLGRVNDSRPWDVDDETLRQVVEVGNASPRGVKARYTHPNMSSDGLGYTLGRWTNFRRDGEFVRADLQLIDAAFSSPKGDLGSHVLDLAEDDPESFGCSAALGLQRKAMATTEDAEGREKIRLHTLRAVDVVGDPAATRTGLFSVDLDDGRDMPAVAAHFLDTHFEGAEPDVLRSRLNGFLDSYFKDRGHDVTAPNNDSELSAVSAPPADPPATPPATNGGAANFDADAERVKIRQEEAKRVNEITAVCSQAGISDEQRQKFINDGTPLATVKDAAIAKLSADRKPPGETPSDDDETPDLTARAEAKLKANIAACPSLAALGITAEDHVKYGPKAG